MNQDKIIIFRKSLKLLLIIFLNLDILINNGLLIIGSLFSIWEIVKEPIERGFSYLIYILLIY
jgi:hypothetical protein